MNDLHSCMFWCVTFSIHVPKAEIGMSHTKTALNKSLGTATRVSLSPCFVTTEFMAIFRQPSRNCQYKLTQRVFSVNFSLSSAVLCYCSFMNWVLDQRISNWILISERSPSCYLVCYVQPASLLSSCISLLCCDYHCLF